jgi:dTDP-4-dehydrorhamnose reductase
MKITVLGANGMAGHVVAGYLAQQGHTVDAVGRDRLDVENPLSIMTFFDQLDADFVVNCIGLLVQPCLQNPARANLINGPGFRTTWNTM